MDTMEDRTEFLNYINSRPLDVHRWSEYPEVNEFVNEIYNELISIKGIGLWSAQMFLIFVLMRIDIFSPGDLALMNSLKVNYKIDIKNKKKCKNIFDMLQVTGDT